MPKSSRIKIIFKDERVISKTSNAALDIARGTFAIFLDHDDELENLSTQNCGRN